MSDLQIVHMKAPVEQAVSWSYQDVVMGSAVYNRFVLGLYDPLVIFFENTFVWRCPSSKILAFYNQHVSGNHLDVGVGTGYYLDKCRFPTATPRIALLDLNPESLRFTAHRLRRYHPAVYQANVLEPIPHPLPRFDTIALTFLLHCMPGTLATKGRLALNHLIPFLKPEGVLFGSTILGQGVEFGLLGRLFMRVYNSYLIPGCRVLYNVEDRLSDLEDALAEYFEQYTVHMVGTVAFFAASRHRRRGL